MDGYVIKIRISFERGRPTGKPGSFEADFFY
jgi:hypothetical protein